MGLILVHELGHFFVARWCGMRVERFSIFFGKPLLRWQRGETEYRLGWLPLGGYVKISGMTREEAVEPEAEGRTYHGSAAWRKVATIAAGPAVNLILAFVCFAAAFWVGVPTTIGNTDRIESVVADSPAAGIGLRPGDRIVSVNGVGSRPPAAGKDPRTLDTERLLNEVRSHAKEPVRVVYERGAARFSKSATPAAETDEDGTPVGRLGIRLEGVVADVRYGPGAGLRRAGGEMRRVTRENITGIGRLFTSEEARRQTGTVATIGKQFNDEVAGRGLALTIWFVGIISFLLGLYNLLPLLPLDGGHIVFALLEKVRGRPLSRAAYERTAIVGLLLIGLLFFTAVRNDIWRFSGGQP